VDNYYLIEGHFVKNPSKIELMNHFREDVTMVSETSNNMLREIWAVSSQNFRENIIYVSITYSLDQDIDKERRFFFKNKGIPLKNVHRLVGLIAPMDYIKNAMKEGLAYAQEA